jgi:hypothetical protein
MLPDEPASIQPKVKRKIAEALEILRALQMPRAQLNDRSALTLLTLLDMRPDSAWSEASNPLRGITEMMDYFAEHFGVRYQPNTRETVRRQTVHQFCQMGLARINPDNPNRAVNSPHTRYQIEETTLDLVRAYGTIGWDTKLKVYLETSEQRQALLATEREMTLIPVIFPDGTETYLTAGGQNELIKDIIEQFCPRFAPGGRIVYVDDAGQKFRDIAITYLLELGIHLDQHGKMPDVIVHFIDNNWLLLIEAVTSHGPIDLKRHNELKNLFGNSSAPLVFVTAFKSRPAMREYLPEIAWETEVWVAEAPSHLIHFNGERFLGPY